MSDAAFWVLTVGSLTMLVGGWGYAALSARRVKKPIGSD